MIKKPFIPEGHVPESFSNKFGPLIKFVLGGWDRMRFRATLRPLFSPPWVRGYLCGAKILLKDFGDHAQSVSEQIRENAIQLAQRAGRCYHYLKSSSIDKEQFVQDLVDRYSIGEGLIGVLGTLECALAVTVRANGKTKRLEPVVEERKGLHLYHYYEHPVMGRCHVRLQTWYPFTVDVCLNGRAWLAQQMDRAHLAYLRLDNAFVDVADPARAQGLLNVQLQTDWIKLLGDLLDQAHPLQDQILGRFGKLAYYWSCTQSEYATDIVFNDPADLAKHYPAFVHHGIMTFSSPRVMRFLGHQVPLKTGRVNGRFKAEARSERIVRHEGVCLRHGIGINGIKAYDKYAGLLRIENTINRPEVFKVYRAEAPPAKLRAIRPSPRAKKPVQPKLPQKNLTSCVAPELGGAPTNRWRPLRRTVVDLPRRAEVSRAANRRYLDALASTQGGYPLGAAVEQICQPVVKEGYRYRGLNPLNGIDAKLLEVVQRGEWSINGFRNRDLRAYIFSSPSRTDQQARRRTGQMSRKIRLLRAHGLIRKLPRTHRYVVTPTGRRLITALMSARKADVEQLTAFAA